MRIILVIVIFANLFCLIPGLALAEEKPLAKASKSPEIPEAHNPEGEPKSQAPSRGIKTPVKAASKDPSAVSNVSKIKPLIDSIFEASDARQQNAQAFEDGLKSKDLKTKVAAIDALGRIGQTESVASLLPLLGHENDEVRKRSAFALGLIGGPIALQAMSDQLAKEKALQVSSVILVSLAHAGSDTLIERGYLSSKSPELRSSAAEALTLSWSWNKGVAKPLDQRVANQLVKMIDEDELPGALHAAYALTRAKGLAKLKLAVKLKKSIEMARAANPSIVPYLIRAYSKSVVEVNTEFMTTYLQDENIKIAIEAARAIGGSKSFSPEIKAIERIVSMSPPSLAVTVLSALKNPTPRPWPPTIQRHIRKKSPWVGQELIKAWARTDGKTYRTTHLGFLKGNSRPLRLAAIDALALLGTDEDIRRLMRLAFDSDPRVVSTALGGLNTIEKKKLPSGFEKRLMGVGHLKDPAVVYYLCENAQTHGLAALISNLAEKYEEFSSPELVEARLAIVQAIVKMKLPNLDHILRKAQKDPVNAIRRAAQPGGIDNSNASVDLADIDSPPFESVRKVFGSKYQVSTSKGKFVLELLSEAPYTAYNFAQLVQQGFYDKRSFHRVVPNFVVQGGDPRGDGFGGPGYMIREEVSLLSHQVGTVGMATAGKDTGGSQFFVNLSNNVHLNGHYTVFAKIVSGMDVIETIEQGDSMLEVKKL